MRQPNKEIPRIFNHLRWVFIPYQRMVTPTDKLRGWMRKGRCSGCEHLPLWGWCYVRYERDGSFVYLSSPDRMFHQAVVVAVEVEVAVAAELEAGFGVTFGIEFDELHTVTRDIGGERDIMHFGHLVMYGDKMLVLDALDRDRMLVVGIIGFKRRECDPATADDGIAGRVENIAAQGADIEF